MIHSHYDPPQILWFLRNYWKHTRENLILEWRRNFRDDGFGKSQYQWLKSRYGMKGEWGAALNTPPYPGAKPGGPNTINYEAPGIPREPPPGNGHTGSSSPAPELSRSSPGAAAAAGTSCRGSTITAANMAAAAALNTSFSFAVPSRPHASFMEHANMGPTSAMATPHIHALGQHHVSPSPSSSRTRNAQSSRSNSRNSDNNDPGNTQTNHEYTIPASLSCDPLASTQTSMPLTAATGAVAAGSSFGHESLFIDAMPFSSGMAACFDTDGSNSFYPLSLPALPASMPYSFSAPQATGFQNFVSDDSSSSLSFLNASVLSASSQYGLDDAYLTSSPSGLGANVPTNAYVAGGTFDGGGSIRSDLGVAAGGHDHLSDTTCSQNQCRAKAEEDCSKRKGPPTGSQDGCRKRRQGDPETPTSSTNVAVSSIQESSPQTIHAVLPPSSAQNATTSVAAYVDTSAIVFGQTKAMGACTSASSSSHGVYWFTGKHGRCELDARHRHDDSGGIYFSSTDDCISAVLSRPGSSSNMNDKNTVGTSPPLNPRSQSDKPPIMLPNILSIETGHLPDIPPSDAVSSNIPSSMSYQAPEIWRRESAKSVIKSAQTVQATAGVDGNHMVSPSALDAGGDGGSSGNKTAAVATVSELHNKESENEGENSTSSPLEHGDSLQPPSSKMFTWKDFTGASKENAPTTPAAAGSSHAVSVSCDTENCMLPMFDSQDDVNTGLGEGLFGGIGCGNSSQSKDFIAGVATASTTKDSLVDGPSSGSESADPEWLLLFDQLTD